MHKNDIAGFQKFMIISWIFKIVQNHQESFKINNFFSSESWEFILFRFYHARAPSCTRARQNNFFLKILRFWDFQRISSIQSKIGARVCARRRAHEKIRKVWTFSFHWKKKLLILNDSWWFWTILKTHEMIMNFWKSAMSFLCIFY